MAVLAYRSDDVANQMSAVDELELLEVGTGRRQARHRCVGDGPGGDGERGEVRRQKRNDVVGKDLIGYRETTFAEFHTRYVILPQSLLKLDPTKQATYMIK